MYNFTVETYVRDAAAYNLVKTHSFDHDIEASHIEPLLSALGYRKSVDGWTKRLAYDTMEIINYKEANNG